MLPDRDDHVGQLFFLLTSSTRRGELDRFFDASYTNATITLFYGSTITTRSRSSIAQAKRYIATLAGPDDTVRYQLAGGLLGILAAVNEEVEWSYRANLGLILAVIFVLSYLTYRSRDRRAHRDAAVARRSADVGGGDVLAGHRLQHQFAARRRGRDRHRHRLRLLRSFAASSRSTEPRKPAASTSAIARAIRTTGKTVLFTGFSLTASIIYFVFFPMKFQAEMALLLSLLLAFHLIGALLFIPPMVNWIRPRFAVAAIEARRASSLAPGEPTRPRRGHAAN